MRLVGGLGALALVLLLTLPPARAEDAGSGQPPDWRAQAVKAKLADVVVDRLDRDGFAVTDKTFEQVFNAYLGSPLPAFITADSVLNAYQVLLEESLLRIETMRAADLHGVLRELWRGIEPKGPTNAVSPDVLARAQKRLRNVLGTAIGLSGSDLPALSAEEREKILAEVARVEAAVGRGRPSWLTPHDQPVPAIDYGEFQPRGLYTRTEALKRYFRAVRFLQQIPFRVDDDIELTAATLLAVHIASDGDSKTWTAADRCRSFLDDLDELLPRSDHLTLEMLSWEIYGEDRSPLAEDSLVGWREEVDEEAADAVLSDHIDVVAARPTLRILPAARLPDAVVLKGGNSDSDPGRGRLGLLVGAALGSAVAHDALDEDETTRVEEASEAFEGGRDLYREHLRCLATLVADPEPDAPELFGSRAWRLKSLQSTLAGWAQLRCGWVLQSKPIYISACDYEDSSGFVEPVPAFYGRMRNLCAHSKEALSPAFHGRYARLRLVAHLKGFIHSVAAQERAGERATDAKPDLTGIDGDDYRSARYLAEYHLKVEDADDLPLDDLVRVVEPVHKVLASDARLPEGLSRYVQRTVCNLKSYWTSMEQGCLYLELLSHKQLREAPFSEEEQRWIRDYGKLLASWMLYCDTAADDDAPRIVDVLVRPISGQYDVVGIGRPQAIFVLYPWADREVLCRGAILPYVEFSGQSRLTDSAWREALGSEAVTDSHRPEWTRGTIVAAERDGGSPRELREARNRDDAR